MELLEGLLSRRSMRKFTGDTLSPAQLETIVKAGMHAPSAHNQRPWHILSVEDKNTHLAIRALGQWWKMLDKAAALMVICADPATNVDDMPWEYIVDGCAAVMQNMLLSAHALDLGAVWLGLCEEKKEAAAEVKKLLAIPANVHIMGMVAVGVPEKPIPNSVDRFEREKWHKERWQ